MRYLVTGGAGFVGSHLVEALIVDGHTVTVVDDLSTGREENLANVGDHPRLRLEIRNVVDGVADLIAEVDAVFHLASVVGVRKVMEVPLQTMRSITDGGAAIIRACALHRKPILITSTSEVYGNMNEMPLSENADLRIGPPTTSRWCYAAAKLLEEHRALAYWREIGLPVVVVRLFNTVGPRQTGRYGMVVPRFVEQAMAGEPLTIHGDGLQTRSFCHVADVARGLIALMDSKQAHGQIVNLGSDRETSILRLAEIVLAQTDSRPGVRCVPKDFADIRRRVPDLQRARQLLGWRPTRTLENAVQDVIDEQRRAINEEQA